MHFIIPIEPKGKKEARRTRSGHVFKHPETRAAMQNIAAVVREQYQGDPLDCPLGIRIIAYCTRPKSKLKAVWADTKPDYDNIEKLIGDALEGILWVNDSRIVDGRCIKKYAPAGKPGWIELELCDQPEAAF
jgi:Holliday junction resolvase RusA-like endonuclease